MAFCPPPGVGSSPRARRSGPRTRPSGGASGPGRGARKQVLPFFKVPDRKEQKGTTVSEQRRCGWTGTPTESAARAGADTCTCMCACAHTARRRFKRSELPPPSLERSPRRYKRESYCLKKGFLQIFNKGAPPFLSNFIPNTISVKVHLSAVSLPRKQLSIKNSA